MIDAPNPKTMLSRVSRAGLWAMRGWRFEGTVPAEPRAVILAGPHTSNVDGVLLVLLTRSVGMKANWMVKDTWAKPPMGWVLDPVGAGGTMCMVPSAANGWNVSVDCDPIAATTHDNGAYGFANDGSLPCGELTFCPLAVEETSWGKVKSLFR